MFSHAKVIAAYVVVVMLSISGFYINRAFIKAAKYDAEVTRREKAERDHAEYIRADKAADAARDKASQGYQDELKTLRTAGTAPPPVVRVCRPAAPAVRTAETPARGPEAAAAPAPVLSAETGGDSTVSRDIGPDLTRLMAEADAVSAQLRAVLKYLEE